MENNLTNLKSKSIPVGDACNLLRNIGVDVEFQDSGLIVRSTRSRQIKEVITPDDVVTVEKLLHIIKDYIQIQEEDKGNPSYNIVEQKFNDVITRIETELREIILHYEGRHGKFDDL